MRIETTFVITDPCYLHGYPTDSPLMRRSTIYGDWSCMVYKGDRKENTLYKQWNETYFNFFKEYNSEPLLSNEEDRVKKFEEFKSFKENWLKENCLGEFCADAGEVGIFNWKTMEPQHREWCETHPWCAAIIRDFKGNVNFEVEHDTVFVVGKGNFDFFSIQSGF